MSATDFVGCGKTPDVKWIIPFVAKLFFPLIGTQFAVITYKLNKSY